MGSPNGHSARKAAAVISVARDTKEGVELLRARLVLFWGVVLSLSWVAVILGTTVGAIALGLSVPSQLRHPGAQAQLAALIINTGLWCLCRFGAPSRRLLDFVDAGSTVALCLGSAVMTYVAPSAAFPSLDVGAPLSTALPAGVLTNLALLTLRAALIPSAPMRTLVISVAASIPVMVAALMIQRQHQDATATSFATGTVGVSALIIAVPVFVSRVIYRLQLRFNEATQLGQYTLEQKIGEGGMGIVYRARHALLRRPTAIKLLSSERAGAHSMLRFEREVQQTSRLSHPNTVAIYDYGHTAEGVFYYAMEYLDGLSLEELVEQDGPQPAGRVVHILRQVLGALAEAHDAGLVHRDIKPANLHLCRRGGIADHVKVLDFGLVKEVAAPESAELSAARTFLGTPLYAAPEAIVRPESVDGRADLYALGAVGYFLLTATTPFRGSTLLEVCSQHLHLPPESPSHRLGHAVPAALEDLVLRCLAKSPEARPPSAVDLSRELAACAGVSPWTEDDAGRWWRQRFDAVLAQGELRRGNASGSGNKTIAVNLQERW